MQKTKYGFSLSESMIAADVNRLTNQLWKLIPMRENEEDWLGQLNTVILEIVGLEEILIDIDYDFLVLLSKLEGLKAYKTSFETYRTTVFKCISLLREMRL